MPRLVTLAPRANATSYDDTQVLEVVALLDQVTYPQAVIIDDTAQDSIGKARNRANVMRDLLARKSVKVKAHGIDAGDGTFYAAVSKPRSAGKKGQPAETNGDTAATPDAPASGAEKGKK